MIYFNQAPYTGREIDYMKDAAEDRKICGDGKYTKKCHAYLNKFFDIRWKCPPFCAIWNPVTR